MPVKMKSKNQDKKGTNDGLSDFFLIVSGEYDKVASKKMIRETIFYLNSTKRVAHQLLITFCITYLTIPGS